MSRGAEVALVTAKGVDEAEGRDREQAGDEVMSGKRVTSTPNKDMIGEMTMFNTGQS